MLCNVMLCYIILHKFTYNYPVARLFFMLHCNTSYTIAHTSVFVYDCTQPVDALTWPKHVAKCKF